MNTETKLFQLRAQTAEIEAELKLRKEVEVESQRHLVATMKLRAANRTLTEQRAYDAETRRWQIGLSRITSSEQHPDWRSQENPNMELYRAQYPGKKP